MLARIKNLGRNLAIYGVGDIATSVVSLLLLPVYTRYLSPEDYGVIAMLLTIEAVSKILFRWGVDTAFMRMFYDCADQPARQRLASTIFFFLLVANGVLVAAALASAGWLSTQLFDTPSYALLVGLVIANTFVVGFYFIPFQVMRIGERSTQFISLVFARSASTLVMRLVLVVGADMGVLGVVVADVLVTAVFTVVLGRWYAPLIRPVFSKPLLREALAFGLPRIPHSLAQQVIGVADRYFLVALVSLRDVGLYSIGASFGLALKLFLSAFEYAWTPFFLGVMKEPNARQIYGSVSTYVLAVLAFLVAVLCAIAPDIIALTTTREFHSAAAVTPWIALGVMFQGIYLVGSIGLIITRKTTVYPLATGIAAGTSLLANALLIPRFGLIGAAWANTIAYGTLACVTVGFSWRAYPIPYEWSRLLRIAVAGGAAYLAGGGLIPMSLRPWTGLLVRPVIILVAYAFGLLIMGFFHAGEMKILQDIRRRALTRHAPEPMTEAAPVEMAGEIIAAGPDPAAEAFEADVSGRAGGKKLDP